MHKFWRLRMFLTLRIKPLHIKHALHLSHNRCFDIWRATLAQALYVLCSRSRSCGVFHSHAASTALDLASVVCRLRLPLPFSPFSPVYCINARAGFECANNGIVNRECDTRWRYMRPKFTVNIDVTLQNLVSRHVL